ncbi:MAG: 16S rRNA (guanine(527)-N(7))-methyltransferase RsmG [Proteobacteria bacterium]|nr:16S rRNA (guanine(527)-N(7))-methyltransferase RsmG [Pseudomonadota bacterium]
MERIADAAAQLGVALTEPQAGQLAGFLDLLAKWNGVYNLTALRTREQMLTHHLLDSLAVVAPLRRHLQQVGKHAGNHPETYKARLLDVGAGAGLPGVVIAVCCPELQVDCVDAVEKKVAFVRQAAAALGLANLRAIHARVETLTDRYDLISARAFASLADLVALSIAALADGGAWLAMKGRRPDDEIAALPEAIDVFHVEPLQVPGLHAERCLVWMRKKTH